MDEHELLAWVEITLSQSIHLAAEEQNREDEQDGWQEFIRCIEIYHPEKTLNVFEAPIDEHEACPGGYLDVEVGIGSVYDPLGSFSFLLQILLPKVHDKREL